MKNETVAELSSRWKLLSWDINKRLTEFKKVFKNSDEERIFAELAFCIFTPQSKAKSCWKSVEKLIEKQLLLRGTASSIANTLEGVRFHNNKSSYLVLARKLFFKDGRLSLKPLIKSFKNPQDAREWLVKNIKGMGLKEATHFLRNIGRCGDLAILDRHILKNLVRCGVIPSVPKSLSKSVYLDIEAKMQAFSKKTGIPMQHIDLLFWSNEAGEIFK